MFMFTLKNFARKRLIWNDKEPLHTTMPVVGVTTKVLKFPYYSPEAVVQE